MKERVGISSRLLRCSFPPLTQDNMHIKILAGPAWKFHIQVVNRAIGELKKKRKRLFFHKRHEANSQAPMHHQFPCIPLPPNLIGKKQLQHGDQVALLFANIPTTRLQVCVSSPAAKVSILPRPRIAPIKQHGSTFHPGILCGSSSTSGLCRSLRHLLRRSATFMHSWRS